MSENHMIVHRMRWIYKRLLIVNMNKTLMDSSQFSYFIPDDQGVIGT